MNMRLAVAKVTILCVEIAVILPCVNVKKSNVTWFKPDSFTKIMSNEE